MTKPKRFAPCGKMLAIAERFDASHSPLFVAAEACKISMIISDYSNEWYGE